MWTSAGSLFKNRLRDPDEVPYSHSLPSVLFHWQNFAKNNLVGVTERRQGAAWRAGRGLLRNEKGSEGPLLLNLLQPAQPPLEGRTTRLRLAWEFPPLHVSLRL